MLASKWFAFVTIGTASSLSWPIKSGVYTIRSFHQVSDYLGLRFDELRNAGGGHEPAFISLGFRPVPQNRHWGLCRVAYFCAEET
jgi:hypothetical protein